MECRYPDIVMCSCCAVVPDLCTVVTVWLSETVCTVCYDLSVSVQTDLSTAMKVEQACYAQVRDACVHQVLALLLNGPFTITFGGG